ncbi:hypothetical protein CQR48_1004 [Bifidobacterium thermophilum]|uniref:hypothetical protein n=1 Tax=Bifidobacterium thermophilum TaxID=33905 RepID=UPI000C707A9D|nr:hypothetical protein [Bifidobacterium thermophilum]PKU89294.1 hypothetical protein CQR48_1004 [Bifidobacterium thermophilum]
MDDHVNHTIGKPVMLSDRDIKERRKVLEQQYGSEATLRRTQMRGTISGDELLALRRFDDLDYLEGARP